MLGEGKSDNVLAAVVDSDALREGTVLVVLLF